jgi:transcription antitermination factor NusG
MRVAYDKSDRVLQIHKYLDQKGIENFLPMKVVHDREDFNVKSRLVPAIPGLIFIHDTRVVITDLKRQPAFSAMRYWTDAVAPEDAEDRILTVPDRQMENFIRTVTANTDKVNFLEYNAAFFSKAGQAVRITDGEFAGCTGTIRRIKKRRCVVVEVNGICAVAITFVPSDWLELI